MELPFGSWPSPISAAQIATSAPRIDGARFVGAEIWWGESVPAEGGRVTIRRQVDNGDILEVLPRPWNARSRVHEYGGGAWTADADGTLFFVQSSDQRIYRVAEGDEPRPLTPQGSRFGGLRWQQETLLAVREEEHSDGAIRRSIITVPVDGSAAEDSAQLTTLADGSDFVAQPALSPDGSRVAWIGWDHPDMPWDRAHLRIRTLDGSVPDITVPARAALQPEWRGANTLLFADDTGLGDAPDGRWGLRSVHVDGSGRIGEVKAIAPSDADTGGGLWVLGQRWYQLLRHDRILALRTHGTDQVVLIDPSSEPQTVRPVSVPAMTRISFEDAQGDRVLLTGSGSKTSSGLWLIDADQDEVMVIRGGQPADPAWTPTVRSFTVEGPHGPVHAFDYPPTNPAIRGPRDARPPYVVWVHGGPTDHVAGAASAVISFFTSRGIGILDVNYSGSSGYGRAYRERLHGQWGIADVDDVIAAARGLADSGHADPERIAIRGGSAGGWTVLCALVRGELFAAGISRYGIGDLRALAEDTHDFEKHYTDRLVGPLPEAEEVYVARSPLTHADRINVPVLLLQGAEDAVVAPTQSEAIRDALHARGVPCDYVLFPGEGHGFRSAETIAAALEAELDFLSRVFGFSPAPDPVIL